MLSIERSVMDAHARLVLERRIARIAKRPRVAFVVVIVAVALVLLVRLTWNGGSRRSALSSLLFPLLVALALALLVLFARFPLRFFAFGLQAGVLLLNLSDSAGPGYDDLGGIASVLDRHLDFEPLVFVVP